MSSGWAYVGSADFATGSGPTGSVQFRAEPGNQITGSARFMYYTGSYDRVNANTLVLTGTLEVVGVISASHYHIKDITEIDATGSTKFGDSADDTHVRTGSMYVYASRTDLEIPSLIVTASSNGTLTRVGIGLPEPSGALHIQTGDAGVAPVAAADDLVVAGSGQTGISVLTPDDQWAYVVLGHPGDASTSLWSDEYDGGNTNFGAATAGHSLHLKSGDFSTALTLDSNQNVTASGGDLIVSNGSVGIGPHTKPPSGSLHVQVGAGAAIAPHAYYDDVVVASDGVAGITILTPGGSGDYHGYAMGVPGDNIAASFNMDYNNNIVQIGASGAGLEFRLLSGNSAEALLLDANQNVTASGGDLIVSNGSVGIGPHTKPPSGSLHVQVGAGAGGVPSALADEFVIASDAAAGMTIITPNDENAYVLLGSPSHDNYSQWIGGYDLGSTIFGTAVAGHTLNLRSGNATTALLLDENQNVTASGGDLLVTNGSITASANITASAFYGIQAQFSGSDQQEILKVYSKSKPYILFITSSGKLAGEARITMGGGPPQADTDGTNNLVTVSGSISASVNVSASQFWGDGTNLTGVDAFPFTGDAEITGSLRITGSDGTSLLVVSGASNVHDILNVSSTHVSASVDISASIYHGTSLAIGTETVLGGTLSTVAGGTKNEATANYSVVVGGYDNTATDTYAFVGGGIQNNALESYSVVVGGSGNDATAHYSTVAGGISNLVGSNGGRSFIGGGDANNVASDYGAIAGGNQNVIGYAGGQVASRSFIGGGNSNTASAQDCVVVGGSQNKISWGGHKAFIGGGQLNTASAQRAAILGGSGSTVSAAGSMAIGSGLAVSTVNTITLGGGTSDGGNHVYSIVVSGTLSASSNVTASGHVSASTYYGDGSNLTGIAAGGGGIFTESDGSKAFTTSSVGIGPSTAPSALLHVSSSDDVLTGSLLQVDSEDLGTLLYVTASGYVGIGTDEPSTLLHVSSSTESLSGEKLLEVTGKALGTVLFVTGSGRVGIGTSNPTEKLEVYPNTDVSAIIGRAQLGTAPGHSGAATFGHLGMGYAEFALYQNSAGLTILNAKAAKPIHFRINNVDKMHLTADGDLGIGTTTPQALLHASSSTESLSGEKLLEVSGKANGTVLFVTGSGRVGIGTTTPDAALTVSGSISASLNVSASQFWGDGSNLTGIAAGGGGGGIFTESDGSKAYTTSSVGVGLSTAPSALLHVSSSDDILTGSLLQVDSEDLGTLLFVTASGYVGIGTQSPSALLHVSSSGDEELFRIDGSVASSAGAPVLFVTGGLVANSGAVGINTSEPDATRYMLNTPMSGVIKAGNIEMGSWPYNPSYAFIGHSGLDHHGGVSPHTYQNIYMNANGQLSLNVPVGQDMYFRVGNAIKAAIDANGFFGIGPNAAHASYWTPSAQLQVSSSDDEMIFLCHDANQNPVLAVTGSGKVGIGTSTPNVALDVYHTGTADPTNLSNDTGGGDVVFFGTSSAALDTGGLYYLNSLGGWQSADAATTGSFADININSGHNQLLGISLGTNPQTSGMLLRGFFDVTTFYSGSFNKGTPVYIQSGSDPAGRAATTGGFISGSTPLELPADSYVRVVGYGTDTPNVIYFNPGTTYIEVEGE